MLKKLSHNSFFLIIVTALLGGSNGVIIKIALQEFSPFTFNFFRFLIATTILLPLLIKRWESIKRAGREVLVVSLFGVGNIVLFAFGVRLTTAISSQVLYAASPLITAILSYFILKEMFTLKKVFGLFLGFIGVSVIIFLPAINSSNQMGGSFTGNILVFLAVMSFSLYTVLSKPYQKKFSPFTLTFGFMLITLVINAALTPLEFQTSLHSKAPSLIAISSLLFVGTLGTSGFYLLYQYLIRNTSPVNASVVLYLTPISAIFSAMILLGEKLTLGVIFGSLLTLAGVWIVDNERRNTTS
ncbi:MAG: DMT family transporter [Patescibacteria group bacterium]